MANSPHETRPGCIPSQPHGLLPSLRRVPLQRPPVTAIFPLFPANDMDRAGGRAADPDAPCASGLSSLTGSERRPPPRRAPGCLARQGGGPGGQLRGSARQWRGVPAAAAAVGSGGGQQWRPGRARARPPLARGPSTYRSVGTQAFPSSVPEAADGRACTLRSSSRGASRGNPGR